MNFWDYLKETPDQRRKRQAKEEKQAKRGRLAPTSHPDDHYGFDGLNAYAARKKKGKH